MAPRVGLVMIVRDEESTIRRALASVRPWISTWVICDTGSKDHTKEIIRETMSDISGLLVERPWVSFEHNRTEALELCRGRMEWAIMLDADDNLEGEVPTPAFWAGLDTDIDAIALRIHHGGIVHQRAQIFRVASDWCYRGVLHEIAECRTRAQPRVVALSAKTYMVTRCEGVRSRDPNKYLKDAALLEAEFWKDTTNMRNLYYLAQSWRDAGKLEQAARYYRMYVDSSGGWEMERYMSFVNLISIVSDPAEKIALAWRAVEVSPNRLEAQYTVLRSRRAAGLPATQQVYALAATVQNRDIHADIIFVNPLVYSWGFDDEFAVVAFATGHYREAYEASVRVALAAPSAEIRENALKNAALSRARLS